MDQQERRLEEVVGEVMIMEQEEVGKQGEARDQGEEGVEEMGEEGSEVERVARENVRLRVALAECRLLVQEQVTGGRWSGGQVAG